MPFEIVKTSIPPRPAALLVTVSVPTPKQIPVIGGPEIPETYVPYDEIAPGLYPDEQVVRLDTGELIALSVSRLRLANGGGMEFEGWARLIEEDGSTKLDKHGQEMELHCKHHATADALDALEGDAPTLLSREIMLMMLGEKPTMRPIAPGEDADANRDRELAPPGTKLDPAATEVAILPCSNEVRLNHSIRHAIALAQSAEPEVDVATLLRA